MPLTLQDMRDLGVLIELARCFDSEPAAVVLLLRIGVSPTAFKPFSSMSIEEWWNHVCEKLENGIISDGLERLISHAAKTYPANTLLKGCLSPESIIENQRLGSGNIDLRLPEDLPLDDIIKIIEASKHTVLETGGNFSLTLGRRGSFLLSLHILNTSTEQIDQIVESIKDLCITYGIKEDVTRKPYLFEDYYLDPISMGLPDEQHFVGDKVLASTSVKELVDGVMESYRKQK